MVPAGDLAAFALTALVIVVIPGPSVLFVVGRALAYGCRAAALTVVGNAAGEYLQVIAVALGVGNLAERSVAALTVVKLFGAAYLIYLGVAAIRDRHSMSAAVSAGPQRSRRRYLRQGFVVGATNPKTVIFLVAVLPLFVVRASGHVTGQILVLGLVFSVIALVSDSIWGLFAGTARAWFTRSPRRLELLGGLGGLAVIAVGAGVAVSAAHE